VKETEIAPAETLLGRLQRGRGSGYLEAIADLGAAARVAVVQCVIMDPRWDAQVEARSTFYANLMMALDQGLDSLEAHLFSDEDYADQDEDRTGLTLHVLGDLARRGRRDGVPILRRYVATGWNWIWALHELVALDLKGATDGLSDVIASRFADDDDLLAALRDANVPSEQWASPNARVTRALDAIAAHQARLKGTGFPPMDSMIGALNGSEAERHAALQNLGTLRSPLVVEAAEAAIRTGPAALRRVARRALVRSSGALGMVERARSWANESNELSEVALHVLARHGTAGDIAFLREQLAQGRVQGHMYQVCDAVEGLGRLADVRSADSIESIYLETTYSYLRRRAAQALAAVSPRFGETLAIESLWDCEKGTRAVGCVSATWARAQVRDRIRELVADVLEEEVVRSAGRTRMDTLSTNGKDSIS
jgi:hypothetical protein